MSLFRRTSNVFGPTPEAMVNDRRALSKPGMPVVTNDTALRHSAVWACLRLRANLISTMPVDVYRKVEGVRVEVPPPPVLVKPGGDRVKIKEWLYSSQVDLDRAGNTIGLITEKHASGMPARIDLQSIGECAIVPATEAEKKRAPDGWVYRICGKRYFPDEVWHEKQYTVPGLPMGLSPVAYAAWTIGEYLSIQDFALDFFGNSGVPAMHLKNTRKRSPKRRRRTPRIGSPRRCSRAGCSCPAATGS
jgi:phage portal protein BeeE